jgi:hypothetical protein
VLIIKTYLIFESTVSAHQNEGALPGTRGGALPGSLHVVEPFRENELHSCVKRKRDEKISAGLESAEMSTTFNYDSNFFVTKPGRTRDRPSCLAVQVSQLSWEPTVKAQCLFLEKNSCDLLFQHFFLILKELSV